MVQFCPMALSTPKQLVLVGGGHSHGLLLKYWQKNRNSAAELTLISDHKTTPYSGMVPGYISGFYDRSECFIDLEKLCRRSGVNFIVDRVTDLDLEQQLVKTSHQTIKFDLVSLDIGSSPFVPAHIDDGAVIPVKPIGDFLCQWDKIKDREQPLTLAIVGGGGGGVELAFNTRAKLKFAQIHLFHQGNSLLPGHNRWVQQTVYRKLLELGIKVHLNSEVIQVKNHILTTRSGFSLTCDFVLWVTQAIGAPWLRSSGLALDDRGFILVNNCLQSLSHQQVFACGDIASLKDNPLPKAGVVAVRQALPLYRNLKRALAQRPLIPYKPQSIYLGLIGTGDGRAIASWGSLGAEGKWLWYLKDYIDRSFMADLKAISIL